MRLLLDPKNEELADILNTLLTDNIDITAREVARRPHLLRRFCVLLAAVPGPQATGRTSSGWKPSSRIWWQPTPASSARFKWPEAGLHLSGSGETTRRWATRYTAFQQPTPSVQ